MLLTCPRTLSRKNTGIDDLPFVLVKSKICRTKVDKSGDPRRGRLINSTLAIERNSESTE